MRMPVLALGVSYRSAPVELLERLTFSDDDLAKAYRRASDDAAIDEAVILSTCNRVEIYAAVPGYHPGFQVLKRLLCESRDVAPDEIDAPLYSHYELDAAEHLFAVASGLDSMVLGEPQILSQVREALKRSQKEDAAGPVLTGVFHTAARTGRRVRTETSIGAAPDAFVAAGADLADATLDGLVGRNVVVVGAGLMSALAVKHVRDRGVASVRILNRSPERARRLAERTGSDHGALDELPSAIAAADLVVSATGAAGTVISASAIGERERPLFVLDLAVPRDVAPDAAALPNVTLVDVEGLRETLSDETASGDVESAEAIIADEVRRFTLRRRAERLAPLINALRRRGEEVVAAELARFRSDLGSLTDDEREAVEAIARGIVAKLLHEPIVRLKELSEPGTQDAHAKLLAELFGVEPGAE
jgi:glutamyl-tRNA reductase